MLKPSGDADGPDTFRSSGSFPNTWARPAGQSIARYPLAGDPQSAWDVRALPCPFRFHDSKDSCPGSTFQE